MLLQLNFVSEVIQANLYLIFVGRCRKIFIRFIIKLLRSEVALFDYSYFRSYADLSKFLVNGGSV